MSAIRIMGGNGFSIFPNFSQYGLLAAWDTEADAHQFFAGHPALDLINRFSSAHWTVYLKTFKAHGEWDGQKPFQVNLEHDPERPVAVLTRATIRPSKMFHFWKYVPGVSQSMNGFPGHVFSVGIGELPLIQQATFSLWEDSEKMRAYAYAGKRHAEVVKQTRKIGWYKEELFARFHPYKLTGQPPENIQALVQTPY